MEELNEQPVILWHVNVMPNAYDIVTYRRRPESCASKVLSFHSDKVYRSKNTGITPARNNFILFNLCTSSVLNNCFCNHVVRAP